MDVALVVGLDGDRHAIGAFQASTNVGERDDALVAESAVGLARDRASEVRLLVPQLRRGRGCLEQQVDDGRRVDLGAFAHAAGQPLDDALDEDAVVVAGAVDGA